MLVKLTSVADPTKLFFPHFLIFAVKLGHFIICEFLYTVCNKNATLPVKDGKILRLRRKKVL